MIKALFYGVRGSYPIARPDQEYYGGNSSCVLIQSKTSALVLDGGTGIISLGMSPNLSLFRNRVDVFITHTMWDHIMGLPFFRPLYQRLTSVNFYGALQYGTSLETLLTQQQESTYFPHRMQDLPSTQSFNTIDENSLIQIGDIEVQPVRLNHAGKTMGYIVTNDNDSIAYLTDTGSFEGPPLGEEMTEASLTMYYRDLVNAVRKCSAIIYDTHFMPDELKLHQDDGHSSYNEAIKLADEANINTICLFHYAPEYTDKDVDLMRERAQKSTSRKIAAAIEGWTLKVEDGAVRYEN